MDILQEVRSKLAVVVAEAIDKKVNGKDITRQIDKELDARLGEKASERIQRGALTNLLLEMIEGLWEEEENFLRMYVKERYKL